MRRPSKVWRWPYSPEQSVLDHRNKTEVLVRMEHLLSYKNYKQKELISKTNSRGARYYCDVEIFSAGVSCFI